MWKTVGFILLFCAVVYADDEKSDCEQDRERRLNATDVGPLHLVPECEENGDYAALQCYAHGWCVCYRRNGDPINSASSKTKACKCIREKDDANVKGGGFKPKCSKDGTYYKRQCIEHDCWCVDKDGVATSEVQSKYDIDCD
uniref:U102-Liphistoxin-Lsp1d_1 n=1 Tax=Liphistius sp. SGP-2016 TaxID=1905180 RepID=A0A4Q8K614_9ARAC